MSPLDRDEIRAILDERTELADDGFTARVIAALPPLAARVTKLAPPRPRSGILFAFAATACALAYATAGAALPRTLAAAFVAPSMTVALAGAAMILVLAIGAFAAQE